MIDFSNITAVALGVEDVLQIQDNLGTVLWQKAQPVMADYFYVEDVSGQPNTLSITRNTANTPAIEVFSSTDQQNWTSMGTTTVGTPLTATIPANSKLYLKATANGWSWSNRQWNTRTTDTDIISASSNFNVGGNIMSLLYNDNFENTSIPNSGWCFYRLFYNISTLISASNLHFNNSTYYGCYCGMFDSCTSLTTPPATLPATTLAEEGYNTMFLGCTSLTTTPTINATSFAYAACYGMFKGCTSLTTAPTLTVTTINRDKQFELMFDGCTVLNKVVINADSLSTSCLTNWLRNVAATGDFYNLGSYTYIIDSPSGIPVGWTEHHSLPVSCNVSISSNGNGSVSVNGVSGDYSDTVMSDTQLTLVATPAAGYTFDSWSDGDTNASRTITVTADLTLTATFAQQVVNYNVSVSAGSNGTVSVNGVTGNYSASVAAGTTLTLAATADSGYMFDEWSDNVSTNPRTITVNSDLTLTASFIVQQQLNNEIWYETNNNQTANFSNTGFNGTQTSNTYSNNKGVATYSGNITSTRGNSSTSRATNLTKISFPDTLTSIGQHSFDSCPLTELDFNNVTSVGSEAFDGNHIQHLHIPATLTNINDNPFRSSYITQITVDSNNPNYNDGSSHNGSNCIMDGTTLKVGTHTTVIPDNCTTIGKWAFSWNQSLTTINFPASITSILQNGADENYSLTTVYARSNPSFGNYAFYNSKTNGTLYYTSNVNYQNWLNVLPSGWTAVLLCNTTISAGNNGSISVNGTSGNYHQSELPSGTQLTLVATPAAGYQFDSWSDGDTNATRTVTITADTTLTASFTQAGEYFYVEDASGSNNTLTIEKHTTDTPTIEVFKSTDGTNWTSMGNTSTSGITATVPANGKLYLKAVTDKWRGSGSTHYHNIGCNANFKIGGHITSLLFGDNYTIYPLNSTTNANAFENLFEGNDYLIDASDLVLPDSTAPYCYFAMFEYDHNLAGAPVLPATTLAMSCYGRLFRDCTSINEIVCYADTIGSDSTFKWVAGVSSTGDFYKLGSAVYSSDENGIPNGWTVHTSL